MDNYIERKRKQKQRDLYKSGFYDNQLKAITASDAALAMDQNCLSACLAKEFNHNFDAYDAAIDAVYNQTRIGGSSLHHLLDGQHDILGAYRAVQDVRADDSFVQELTQAIEHLLRDTTSVSGVNLLTSLTPDQFNKLSHATSYLGISRPFLADILTVNATEILGGSMAAASSLILGKHKDIGRLSQLSGSFVVSSLVSANPALLTVAASGLIYSVKSADNNIDVLRKAGHGSIISGASILTGALIPGPGWFTMLAAFGAALAMQYAIDSPEKTMARLQLIKQPVESVYRQVHCALKDRSVYE